MTKLNEDAGESSKKAGRSRKNSSVAYCVSENSEKTHELLQGLDEERAATRASTSGASGRAANSSRPTPKTPATGRPGSSSAGEAPARRAPAPNGFAPLVARRARALTHRPCRRNLRGRAPHHGRRGLGDHERRAHRTSAREYLSVSARAALGERIARADFLLRRSGRLARAAIPLCVERRGGQVAQRARRPGTCCSSRCASGRGRANW